MRADDGLRDGVNRSIAARGNEELNACFQSFANEGGDVDARLHLDRLEISLRCGLPDRRRAFSIGDSGSRIQEKGSAFLQFDRLGAASFDVGYATPRITLCIVPAS